MTLTLSDFDYSLPRELIAQYPLRERDAARLLAVERGTGKISHCPFREIKNFLREGDLLVLNDTKVLPCRLKGRKLSGGKAEVLLLSRKAGLTFRALVKPSRLRKGERLLFAAGKLPAEITAKNEITFSCADISEIYSCGVVPLPPYIKREPDEDDRHFYQTVYAKNPGAVAAPTAGLHFTAGLLEEIRTQGVQTAALTLHVGYGTFKPVKEEEVIRHKMEAEYYRIPAETAKKLKDAKRSGARVLAVGTTCVRALESFAATGEISGSARLFIYPGYKFKAVDCLLTNFHFPRTTLFMLVCAFAGTELAKKAYAEAIAQKYRFYSYGDAMLIM
jgi:S-adenosylmethionine:tRNA ribosyltransferase-isomerase